MVALRLSGEFTLQNNAFFTVGGTSGGSCNGPPVASTASITGSAPALAGSQLLGFFALLDRRPFDQDTAFPLTPLFRQRFAAGLSLFESSVYIELSSPAPTADDVPINLLLDGDADWLGYRLEVRPPP